MSRSIPARRKFVAILAECVEAFSIIRAPLWVTAFLVVVLVLPAQSTENYRVLVQDAWIKYFFNCRSALFSAATECDRFDLLREPAASLLGVMIYCVVLLLLVGDIVASQNMGPNAALGLKHRILEWCPKALVAAVFLGVAFGLYLAIPYSINAQNTSLIRAIATRTLAAAGTSNPSAEDFAAEERVVTILTLFSDKLLAGAAVLVVFAFISVMLLPKGKPGSRHGNPKSSTAYAMGAAIGGFAVMTGLALWQPVWLAQNVGPIAVITLFFTLILIISTQITFWSSALRVPFVLLLIIWVAINAFIGINNNHRIRAAVVGKALTSETPALKENLSRWYKSRTDVSRYENRPYPLYVVAAPGGGIYAAYHAARLLGIVADRCPTFSDHLFAVSSVSGGSVGASLFAALSLASPAKAEGERGCAPASVPSEELQLRVGSLGYMAKKALSRDLLAPLVAGMVFPDFLQQFLPFPVYAFDRTRWLEYAFEDALEAVLVDERRRSTAWHGAVNYLERPYVEHWNPEGRSPALILNSTEVSTGERRIIAPFTFESRSKLFVPIWDRAKELAGMTLGTAAMVSARFPWMTPAASFVERTGDRDRLVQLVDGGYYDNSGVATAIDLKVAIESAARELKIGDRIVVKMIVLSATPTVASISRSFNELLDPIRAMLNSWDTRSQQTVQQAQEAFADPKSSVRVMRIVHLDGLLYGLPLGWRLSNGTISLLDAQDPLPNSCQTEAAPAGLYRFEADCLLKDIQADLN